MKQITERSELFELNWRDTLKGMIIAVGTPLLYYVQEVIPGLTNLEPIVKIALSAFVTYLIKNFLSDDKGRVFGIGSQKKVNK